MAAGLVQSVCLETITRVQIHLLPFALKSLEQIYHWVLTSFVKLKNDYLMLLLVVDGA